MKMISFNMFPRVLPFPAFSRFQVFKIIKYREAKKTLSWSSATFTRKWRQNTHLIGCLASLLRHFPRILVMFRRQRTEKNTLRKNGKLRVWT